MAGFMAELTSALPGTACAWPRPAAAERRPACGQRRRQLVRAWSGVHQPSATPEQPSSSVMLQQRRSLLAGGLLLAGAAVLAPAPPSKAAEEASLTATSSSSSSSSSSGGAGKELVPFSNPAQGYTLLRPTGWEQVGKAGADSLFRDPAQKSTTVGVTVYPVTIDSLEQFGDLQTVGERLLNTEREKESTLGAVMVAQSSRSDPAGGFSIYDFEYELESTRGRKRILSTVAIAGRKLYIANGNVSCGKNPSCEGAEAVLPLVRRVTQSIQIGSGR